MVQLLDLPTEILSEISNHLGYLVDLNALIRTCRFFYTLLNDRLYRRICRAPPSSVPLVFRKTVLDWAAENGKSDCVRRLLQAGFPHEASFPPETTPPHETILNCSHPIIEAAACGYEEVVRLFIEYGVDPNPPTGFHLQFGSRFGNPLTVAVKHGQESVVRLLIDHGVDLEYDSHIPDAQQPLSEAANYQQVTMAKLLLEQGCNPLTPNNSRDDIDVDAFAWAAVTDLENLKLFIDAGVDPHTAGRPNLWPQALESALLAGDVARVTFLLDHVIGPSVVDDPGSFVDSRFQGVRVYTHFANASRSRPEIAQLLLQAIDLDGLLESGSWNPICHLMHGAAAGGNEQLMDRLLRTDLASKHPIEAQELSYELEMCLLRAIKEGHTGIVNQLLDRGLDPNDTDVDDLENPATPLIFEAMCRGDTKMVTLLLDRGANPAPPGQPLPWTLVLSNAKNSDEKLAMVRLLLERNLLVPDESTLDHDKLILAAVREGETVFDLVRQHLQTTLQPECKAHGTAFARAAVFGEIAIVKQFLDAGFDPNFCGEDGGEQSRRLWLLAHAARAPDREMAEQTVDLLLERGADLEARDHQTNMTPLLMLTDHAFTRYYAVALLLKKGADPFCTCSNGETPLVKAARKGNAPVVRTLLEFFEQQNMPFDRIKDLVVTAARSTRRWDVARMLWRYYWPRVYPCPQN